MLGRPLWASTRPSVTFHDRRSRPIPAARHAASAKAQCRRKQTSVSALSDTVQLYSDKEFGKLWEVALYRPRRSASPPHNESKALRKSPHRAEPTAPSSISQPLGKLLPSLCNRPRPLDAHVHRAGLSRWLLHWSITRTDRRHAHERLAPTRTHIRQRHRRERSIRVISSFHRCRANVGFGPIIAMPTQSYARLQSGGTAAVGC